MSTHLHRSLLTFDETTYNNLYQWSLQVNPRDDLYGCIVYAMDKLWSTFTDQQRSAFADAQEDTRWELMIS